MPDNKPTAAMRRYDDPIRYPHPKMSGRYDHITARMIVDELIASVSKRGLHMVTPADAGLADSLIGGAMIRAGIDPADIPREDVPNAGRVLVDLEAPVSTRFVNVISTARTIERIGKYPAWYVMRVVSDGMKGFLT